MGGFYVGVKLEQGGFVKNSATITITITISITITIIITIRGSDKIKPFKPRLKTITIFADNLWLKNA